MRTTNRIGIDEDGVCSSSTFFFLLVFCLHSLSSFVATLTLLVDGLCADPPSSWNCNITTPKTTLACLQFCIFAILFFPLILIRPSLSLSSPCSAVYSSDWPFRSPYGCMGHLITLLWKYIKCLYVIEQGIENGKNV